MNRRTGVTLIELLMVIAIVGILAGAAIVSTSPAQNSQLRAAAEIVAEDMAYVRSLAVTYNSKYQLTFDADGNRYVLRHSGTDIELHTLPTGARVTYSTNAAEQVFEFDDLPGLSDSIRLMGVRTGGTTPTTVTTLEFGPLGQTTESATTIIWLTAGRGDGLRFISISVDPVSGLTTIGDVQATAPSGLALPVDAVAI
jgi:prepilin-type N-terminal cleavage/methylation domain-containing protein